MTVKAKLIDVTKCIGCRACQVSCKRWNDRPAVKTEQNDEWTNPLSLSPQTFMFIRFKLFDYGNDNLAMRFVKYQCMHCNEPPCLPVCPVNAIYKREDGVVHTHDDVCIGCGSCVMSCPYGVRHKDEERGTATLKCTLCMDRIEKGLEPSCVSVCPTGALDFGDGDYIVAKARARAEKVGGYVYGDESDGIGTSVIYVSDIPFEEYGFFPTKDMRVYPPDAVKKLAPSIGGMAIVGLAGLAALGFIARRKKEIGEKAKSEG